MKILVLESSGLVASVALMEDDKMVGEFTTNYKKTHSQTLLPMVDEMVKMLGVDLKELDAIGISKGPGSFTGLRIGSATAKGLSQTLNIPVVPVSSLEGLAANLFGTAGVICPMMDARRAQVYTGVYAYDGTELVTKVEDCAIPVSELIDILNQMGEPVILLGDGVPVYETLLKEGLKVPYQIAPAHLNRQRAGAVGTIAMQYLAQGKVESSRDHKPEYLRKSQAERELLEKQKAKENDN